MIQKLLCVSANHAADKHLSYLNHRSQSVAQSYLPLRDLHSAWSAHYDPIGDSKGLCHKHSRVVDQVVPSSSSAYLHYISVTDIVNDKLGSPLRGRFALWRIMSFAGFCIAGVFAHLLAAFVAAGAEASGVRTWVRRPSVNTFGQLPASAGAVPKTVPLAGSEATDARSTYDRRRCERRRRPRERLSVQPRIQASIRRSTPTRYPKNALRAGHVALPRNFVAG